MRNQSVPTTAPAQAAGTVNGNARHSKTVGSLISHDVKPKTPLPNVIVATVNAAPSWMSIPSAMSAGTKTMPPPTGTLFASIAANTPMQPMYHTSRTARQSATPNTATHHRMGSAPSTRLAGRSNGLCSLFGGVAAGESSALPIAIGSILLAMVPPINTKGPLESDSRHVLYSTLATRTRQVARLLCKLYKQNQATRNGRLLFTTTFV